MSEIAVKTAPIIGPMGMSVGTIVQEGSSSIPAISNQMRTLKEKQSEEIAILLSKLDPQKRHRTRRRRTRRNWLENQTLVVKMN